MFTGIVQALGRIRALEQRGGDVRLTVAIGKLPWDKVQLGDSICVSGACLTAVDIGEDYFSADVSLETLKLTTLGEKKVGAAVNLERSLTPETSMGGHIVTGHVDGVGEIRAKQPLGRAVQYTVEVPDSLARYIAGKGSVCVDGVSLTVNAVEQNRFQLAIIPHTAEETTIGQIDVGHRVNIEVDIIARYLERLLTAGGIEAGANAVNYGVTLDKLQQSGFVKS